MWDSLIHWAADVENLKFAFMWLIAIPLSGFVLSFIWHTLRNNYRARVKARLPETNCDCGGCAVLKKDQTPETTPEAHTIPETALKSLAERERIAQAYDLGAKRRAWARDQDIEAEINEMIGVVREGDHRG